MNHNHISIANRLVSDYDQSVRALLASIPWTTLASLKTTIWDTVSSSHDIFVFGNGGSHAIARLARSMLQDKGSLMTCAPRVHTTCIDDWNFAHSQKHCSGMTDMLRRWKAGEQSTVILISASGQSENILAAAKYCSDHGIPCYTFTGLDGVDTSSVTTSHVYVSSKDQQVIEDVTQYALLYSLESYTPPTYAGMLERLNQVQPVDGKSLLGAAQDIVSVFKNGRAVHVLSQSNGPAQIVAEHVAHNLNWDAVFRLSDIPIRMVLGPPHGCDRSGIANDRSTQNAVYRNAIARVRPEDVLLQFDIDTRSAIPHLPGAHIHHFACRPMYNRTAVPLGRVQTAGHQIGKLVRWLLDPSDFDPMTDDLAQKRDLESPFVP